MNRYIYGRSRDATAEEALRGFQRFPTWMWRNAVVLDFVGWLRERNDRVGDERGKAGFYGLDLYSLYRSIQEVIAYLERVDPAAAARARERYACFDHYSADDGQTYGFAAAFGAGETCEKEVAEQLVDLQRHSFEYAKRDGLLAEDEFFYAEQNAKTVKDAAEYYRSMFSGRASLLFFGVAPDAAETLRAARLERAIGVIYRPETERQSHYFQARVANQFDAVVHIDDTRAVKPLERTAGWEEGEAPETYPFAV